MSDHYLPEQPQLTRQDGVYRPAVCKTDSPILSKKFSRLSAKVPELPVVVARTTRQYSHLRGTRDRHSVARILLTILESFIEEDEVVRHQLQNLAFESVCIELGIESCIYQELEKRISRCCKDHFSCFPCC